MVQVQVRKPISGASFCAGDVRSLKDLQEAVQREWKVIPLCQKLLLQGGRQLVDDDDLDVLCEAGVVAVIDMIVSNEGLINDLRNGHLQRQQEAVRALRRMDFTCCPEELLTAVLSIEHFVVPAPPIRRLLRLADGACLRSAASSVTSDLGLKLLAELLGEAEAGREGVVEALVEMLSHTASDRFVALASLCKIAKRWPLKEDSPVLEALVNEVQRGNATGRREQTEAIATLGEVAPRGDERATQALLSVLRRRITPQWKAATMRALGSIAARGHKETLSVLLDELFHAVTAEKETSPHPFVLLSDVADDDFLESEDMGTVICAVTQKDAAAIALLPGLARRIRSGGAVEE